MARILCIMALVCAAPGLAGAQPSPERERPATPDTPSGPQPDDPGLTPEKDPGLRPVSPPPPPPPPPPGVAPRRQAGDRERPPEPPDEAERWRDPYRGERRPPRLTLGRRLPPLRPTPVGGWSLGRRRFGILLELGYPFLDFRLAYGITDRVLIAVGYRGLYSMSSSGYGLIKIQLFEHSSRKVALSLTALGGYTHVRDDDETVTSLVGGYGGFGEALLQVSIRWRRHALMLGGGIRVHQVIEHCNEGEPDYDWCGDFVFKGEGGVLATAIVELGWAMRVMRNASYYIAAGADLFTNSKALPAMVRFRTGVMLDF